MRRLVSCACAAAAAIGLAVAAPVLVTSASADPAGVTFSTLGTNSFTDNTQCADANARFSQANTGAGAVGVAIGPQGQLFVTDDGGDRVLEWPNADALTTCQAATVIGAGSFGASTGNGAEGIAVSSSGVLAVASTGLSKIFVFTPTNGVYSTAPVVIGSHGSGPAQLQEARGLAFTASGQLAVADDNNNRVDIFAAPFTNGESALTTFSGGGVVQNPKAVVVSGQNLYVCSFYTDTIYRFTGPFGAGSNPTPTALFTTDPTDSQAHNPVDLGMTPDGSLLVSEINTTGGSDEVSVFPHADAATGTASPGIQPSTHYTFGNQPTNASFGIAADPAGRLFWADSANNRVLIENPATGAPTLTITSGAPPAATQNVAYSPFTESVTGGTGADTWSIGAGALPSGLSLSSAGVISGTPTATGAFSFTVSVHDSGNPVQTATQQQSITVSGPDFPNYTLSTLGTVGYNDNTQCAAANARFTTGHGDFGPVATAVSTTGRLFVLDDGGSRVLSWPNADALTQCQSADLVIGSGVLSSGEGLTVGPDNTLYVADTEGQKVYIFKPAGGVYPATPSVTLGTGTYGSAANQFTDPRGLALTAQGQLAVADDNDGSVRIFNAPFTNGESASLTLGSGTLGFVKAVAVSGNNLYAVNYYSDEIDRFTGPFTAGGNYPVTARFTTDPTDSQTRNPVDLSMSPTGSLLVSAQDDSGNTGAQVQVFPNADSVTATASPGVTRSSVLTFGGQPVYAAFGILEDAAGRYFWSDWDNNRVIIENPPAAPTLTITSAAPHAVTANSTYVAFTETASGGTGADTWSLSEGALPPGLSLSSAGVISGVAGGPGTYTFTVSVHDSGTPVQTATQQQSITVNPAPATLTITSGTPGSGTVGVVYPNFTETASGGTGADSWSLTAGSLPPGLSLSTSGVVSGTPTTAGRFSFTVTVTDSAGRPQTASAQQSITINPAALTITSAAPAAGVVGTPYPAFTETASGGTGADTWSVSVGSVPPGLSLSAAGVITGTPTVAGVYSFTVSVHDAGAPVQTVTGSQSITINPPSDPNYTFSTLGTVSFTDNTQCGASAARFTTAHGQVGPYGIAIAANGRLFALDGGGQRVLSWPNADALTQCQPADEIIGAGDFVDAESITVGPDNSLYVVDTANAVVDVFTPNSSGAYPATPTVELPQGENPRGVALTQQGQLAVGQENEGAVWIFNAPFTTGEAPIKHLGVGTLTEVLSIAVSGNNLYVANYDSDEIDRFTGPFTATSTDPVTARFTTDPAASQKMNPVDMTVTPTGSLLVTVADLASNFVNTGAVQVFPNANFATSTTAPGIGHSSVLTTFLGQTVRLPEGIAQDASGRVFLADPGSLRLVVATPKTAPPALLTIAPGAIPTLAKGFTFVTNETVTNPSGGGPYTWAVTGGSLPPGLSLDASGQVTGTPTTLGTYTFDLNVHDSSSPNRVGFRSEQVTVATMAISTPLLPDATVEATYAETLAEQGGKSAFVWSLAPGSVLPPGLKLSTAGKITGTVTCQGPATGCAGGSGLVTFDVHDATKPTANTATRTYYLTVDPTHITSSVLPEGTINVAYKSTKLTAVGGGTLKWSLQAGQVLPPGLKLATTGTITGTPTVAGSYAVGIAAQNSKTGAQFQSATATIHILIDPVHITSTKPITPTIQVGKTFPAFAEKAAGAKGATHWSISNAVLPPGLKLTATNGQISGKPTGAGTYLFTVQVTDSATPTANQASITYQVVVTP